MVKKTERNELMAKLIMMKDGEVERELYDSQFKTLSLDKKAEIYNLKHSKGYQFFCDCQKEKIEMSIGNREDTYYFLNLPSNGEKHNITCSLHASFSGGEDLMKGWEENGENLLVNLSRTAFGKKNKKKAPDETELLIEPRRLYEKGKGSSNTVTLMGLTAKLNIMAWDRYIQKNQSLPSGIQDVLRFAYGMSRKIQIDKNSNLYDYWYSEWKSDSKNEYAFVYMPLTRIAEQKHSKYQNLILSQFIKGKESSERISCPVDIFEEARKSIKMKPIEKVDGKFTTIVGGFVKKNSKGYPEFVSIALLPITSSGLWCESSYEDLVYSKLVKENRLFTKGYKVIEEYGGFIPDIIFLGTEKVKYGEIFGVNGVDSYDARKEEKIELAKTSKEVFDFWCWDVAKSAVPPSFEEKL